MSKTLTHCGWLLALVLAGCAPASKDAKEDDKEEPCPLCADKSAKADGTGDGCCEVEETKGVTLKAVTAEQLSGAIASHKGKVVVVDLWASFCGPCKKEFPHLVELHRAYGPDGLVCLSVSLDGEEDAGKALEFLKKQQSTFDNYRLNDESGDWLRGVGSKTIPVVLVYGRDGKQTATFTNDRGAFTYENDVVPLVRKLLRAR